MKFRVGIVLMSFGLIYCSTNDRLNNQSSTVFQDDGFEKFIKKFGEDSTFQSNHINYPLPYFYYTEESEEFVRKEINKGEWRFANFSDNSLGKTLEVDAFEVVIEKKDSINSTYSLRGIDNGIVIIYEFKKDKSQWNLVKFTNASD